AGGLLAQVADRRRGRLAGSGPPRIDVQAAAARVARLHRKPLRAAARQHVQEDLLHALLVETGVLAVTGDVAQQRPPVDAWAAVAQVHAAPVGLSGDRAVGLEHARAQVFLDNVP